MTHNLDCLDTVILAGGINRISLFDGYTPGYKALLPMHGRPSIAYTLEALRAVPAVGRLCIVGDEEALRPVVDGPCAFAPGGEEMMESIAAGLHYFADSPLVLVATADMPLVSSRAVIDFLDGCAGIESDYADNVYISMVPERCYTGEYARFSKGFNRFRDVAVCHGNVMLISPRVLAHTAATSRMNALYHARKDAARAALAIGWRVGLSYLFGVHLRHLLTMAHMARLVSHRFGIGFLPVLVEHPGIAIDIDEPADYAFVSSRLAHAARDAGEQ